ncbi:MAG: restriction endonuclease subunit S [Anaerolineae bacterium]|nr:restriction endonuclease subunit S [Anaerolineae bacterium]
MRCTDRAKREGAPASSGFRPPRIKLAAQFILARRSSIHSFFNSGFGTSTQTYGNKANQGGGSQPNLNQGIIRKLKPPLPAPPEQCKYAEYLKQVEAEIAEMRKTQEDDSRLLSQMQQAILAQAFRGEL